MTTTLAKVKRLYDTAEASLSMIAKQWAYGADTRRIVVCESDGSTKRYYWDSTRLADTGGTYGTALIGSPGITGITPNGGSSGGTATLANMLTGFRDSTVLKSPYSSTVNVIQPTADYIALRVRGYASGIADLQRWETSAGTAIAWVDYAGNINASNSISTGIGFYLVNSDNANGGAFSKMYIRSGGASGGDPYVHFYIAGVTDWAAGVDNSASDSFVISASSTLGTSNALTITTGGLVTVPGTFAVTSSSTFNGAATFNSTTTIASDSYWSGDLIFTDTTLNIYSDSADGSDNRRINIAAGGDSGGSPSRGAYINLYGNENAGNGSAILGAGNHASATLGLYIGSGTAALLIDSSKNISIPGGNVSITRSNSGGTVNGEINNTSNTANSAARLTIEVAGSSASDAFIYFRVNSVTDWTMGVDNSDSDYFKISKSTGLGTSDVIALSGTTAYLYSDLRVSYSNSGNAAYALIENTSTSASSYATVAITVAGTSAGDPFISFNITSGTSWSIGADNDASDSFKISNATVLGSSDALVIDTALLVTAKASLAVEGNYIAFPQRSGDPSSPSNGWMYYDTASGHLRARVGGAWVEVA